MTPSNRPIRLLSVGSLPPEWGGTQRGGVATFHATLLTELSSHRYPVECAGVLVAPSDDIDRRRARRIGAPVIPLPSHRERKRAYRRALRRAKPDVVLFNHVVGRSVGSLVKIHRRIAPETPSIGVAHSWHEITQTEGRRSKRGLIRTRDALRALDALAFGSQHCRREGVQLGLEYPPIAEVIPYPLAHSYASPLAALPSRRRGVIYVGSLIPRKNLAALIEAIARQPELELTLAGEGREEDRLRDLVASLGASRRIRFLPHFPVRTHLARTRRLMRRAEVLCLPSRSESFGLVLTEALACGTPVVGFGPTLAEIEPLVGTDCGESLETGSAEEIGTALERVLSRRWDRRLLRQAVVRAFDPRYAAARYTDLISGLVEDARIKPMGSGQFQP